jgi:putative ABC transport system permease protein
MQTLWHDLRYALRLLLRSPAFAVTAVVTLALALGANAAIFSAVKGVLIAPLPYHDPDRLVRLFEEAPTTPHFPFSPADFRDYRDELRTFDGIAAYLRNDLQLGDAEAPEQLRGMQVTAGFFHLLGWRPALGRDFTVDDEIPGRDDVVVLSDALWRRRFSGDPAVVGRPVRLSGRMFRIVGVLPAGFQHVGGSYRTYGHGETVDVWSILAPPRGNNPRDRFSHYFNVVARVKTTAGGAAVAEDLRRTARSVATRYPSPNSPWVARMVPLKEEIVGTAETTLVALSSAATIVLVLACVNVAGLLLGRAAARAREISVRAALGATRLRLARQLMIESLVVAIAGGILGVVLAYGAVAALARFGPADTPRLQAIAVDADVLVYALVATVFSALLFGLTPAWQLARSGVADMLKQGGRSVAGVSHQRMRGALAVLEIALAFVLVVSSGLLLRSFVSMMSTTPGFRPSGALTASIELPTARYDVDGATAFYTRALARIGSLPQVRQAAFASDLPWTGYDENTSFAIIGRQFPAGEGPEARYHFITAGYTAATGTPLVAGRDLSASDVKDAPAVVLINESTARKYWGTAESAVGARLDLWGAQRTVAGVVADVRDMPWHDAAVPALYFPQPQMWYPQRMFLIVRSDVDPALLIESIRRAVREIDPALPLANVRSLDMVTGAAIATRRLTLWLVAAFGLTALFLAIVGIYGVIAQGVGQRTQEFGVRQALGATRGDILRLVMSRGARLAIVGLTAGLLLSLASTRLLASLLYGISAADVPTFIAVSALLLMAALVATYVPAWRATRISAASALRGE